MASIDLSALPQSGRIDGWRDFQDRVGAAWAVLATSPVNVLLCDVSFARWPLGQRSAMLALAQWCHVGARPRMDVLVAEPQALLREHPRWVAWQATWSHRVACWQVPDEWCDALKPTLLLDGVLGLRLLEPLTGQGLWTRDPRQVQDWREEFDVILQRSSSVSPSGTLGL